MQQWGLLSQGNIHKTDKKVKFNLCGLYDVMKIKLKCAHCLIFTQKQIML